MKGNNITTAPCVDDYEKQEAAWMRSRYYDGTIDFYSFITTPSAARGLFIKECGRQVAFSGALAIIKI